MLEKFNQIAEDLKKNAISPGVAMSNCFVANPTARESFQYNDTTYLPFYYHLGKYVNAKNLLIMGVETGILAACFLKNCKVNNILAFQEKTKEYYSPRIVSSNIFKQNKNNLDIYYGDALDEEFQNKIVKEEWDCTLINLDLNYDKLRNYYDIAWNNLKLDGIMVIESNVSNYSKKATEDFLSVIQKDYIKFKTRYETVVVEK